MLLKYIVKFLRRFWYGPQFEMVGYKISSLPEGFYEYKDDKNHLPFLVKWFYNDNSYEIYLYDAFKKYKIPYEDRELIKKRVSDFIEFYGGETTWPIFKGLDNVNE